MHNYLLVNVLGLRYRFTPAYVFLICIIYRKIKLCRLGWSDSVIPAGAEASSHA
jgi:hypothetical protein